MEIQNLESLSIRDKDRQAIESYIKHVSRELEKELKSVIAYGSAVKDNYFPGSSDLNLIVLVDHFTPDVLKKISLIAKGFWSRSKISTLLVDIDDIRDSADVFPIKYLDIMAHHKVLIGEDIFDGIRIVDSDVRCDLERHIRNMALEIRRTYMLSNFTAGEIRDILVTNFSGFSQYMGALLHLKSAKPPVKKQEIIKMVSEIFKLDLSVLDRVVDLKTGGNNPPRAEMQALFDEYLVAIDEIVEIVDKLEVD